MPDKTVDLRSDTVTLPTKEMKVAMMNAALGDDGYGEDATVNQLQALAAGKLGMEAALYVPSGTMGNVCALLAHTRSGDDVLFEEYAHPSVGNRFPARFLMPELRHAERTRLDRRSSSFVQKFQHPIHHVCTP